MSEIRNKIQQLTTEIKKLSRELSSMNRSEARELVDEVLTTEVITEFKGALDDVRHLTWIYMDALARVQGKEPLVSDHSTTRKITEISRRDDRGAAPFATFVEHVQDVVDAHQAAAEKRPKRASSDAA